jgi:hypothetical protein
MSSNPEKLSQESQQQQRRRRRRLKHRRARWEERQLRTSQERVVVQQQLKDLLSSVFLRSVKKGQPLALQALLAEAQKKGIKHVTLTDIQQFLTQFPGWQQYRQFRKRHPTPYQTHFITKFMTLQVDVAYMKKQWRKYNNNCIGFLLACEVGIGLLAAIPLQRKTLSAFEDALARLLQLSAMSHVRVILSDRETSLHSKTFRDQIKKRYNIQLAYLQLRSKSYLAERQILSARTYLSTAMTLLKTKRWIDLLEQYIRNHNRQVVPRTKVRRVDVTPENYYQVLEQALGIVDYRQLMNVAFIDGRSFRHKQWTREMFEYDVGDRVLLHRSLVYPKETFKKPSARGYFAEEPFIVVTRRLATTKTLALIPGRQRLLLVVVAYEVIEIDHLMKGPTCWRTNHVCSLFYVFQFTSLRKYPRPVPFQDGCMNVKCAE